MTISITTNPLDEKVFKQLTFIGKHSKSTDGKSTFSFTTPSSAELDVLHDYYADGVAYLNSMSQFFVTAATTPSSPETGGSAVGAITLSFPSNHNAQMDNTIKLVFISFLVAYALYAWTSVVSPQLAERFKRELEDKLEALMRLIWHKAPPSVSYDDSLPPVINVPPTIILSDGEAMDIHYSVGSDGVDDIEVESSDSSMVSVSKSAQKHIITITGHNDVPDSVVTSEVSFTSVEHPEINQSVSVTVAGTESVEPTATTPTLIHGVQPGGSTTINIKEGELRYLLIIPGSKGLGTITFSNNTPDKIGIDYWVGSATIVVTAIEKGNWSVVFNDNLYEGSYTLNFVVSEAEVTPDHGGDSTEEPAWIVAPPQAVELEVNGTARYYMYRLGSDGVDSLMASVADSSKVVVTKNNSRREFIVTPVGAGTTTVSFVDTQHPSMNRTLSVTIADQGQSTTPQTAPAIYPIYWDTTTHELAMGDSSTFRFAYRGSDERFNPPDIVATSSDTSVLTVSVNEGVVTVTPVGVGSATVTCRRQGDSETLATVSYTVKAAENNPRWLNIQSLYTLTVGQSGPTIAYELGTDNVDSIQASVDGNAITVTKDANRHFFYIAPVSAGSATVHFSDANHPNMDAYVSVAVTDSGGGGEQSSLVISPSQQTQQTWELPIGRRNSFGFAYVDKQDIPDIEVQSSDTSVVTATVNVDGNTTYVTVDAVGVGSAAVVCTSPDHPGVTWTVNYRVVIPEYDSSMDSDNGVYVFLKKTVGGATNPIIHLRTSGSGSPSASLCKLPTGRDYFVVVGYNESTNNAELFTDYDFSAIESEIVSALAQYNITIQSCDEELSYDLPTAYITPAPSGSLPDGIYYLRCSDMSLDQGITMNNPVIRVTDGVVKCCVDSGEYILSYNPTRQTYTRGAYYLGETLRSSVVVRRAVNAIADMGYVAEESASNDNMVMTDTSLIPTGMIPAEKYQNSD